MSCATRRLLLALHLLLAASAALALDLTFLDVGQGTSVLIEAPIGQAALFDAGPASGNAAAQLRALGVTNLGLVVASHADADHIGGMAEVLHAFEPRFYVDNGIPHTTLTYERTLRAAQAAGVQLLEPTRRTITLGDVRLTVLPPPPGTRARGRTATASGSASTTGTSARCCLVMRKGRSGRGGCGTTPTS